VDLLAKNNLGSVSIKEKQVLEINKSLKNLIEENQGLVNKNSSLVQKVSELKNSTTMQDGRYDSLKKDRDRLNANIKKVRNTNRRYSKKIKELEDQINALEIQKSEHKKKEEFLVEELGKQDALQDFMEEGAEPLLLASTARDKDVKEREIKTMDLLAKIDAFSEEDDRLREDSAKAHYNMGNIYFQKGEFEIAAREYYQAVTLMPNDPDVHYNLAFVSIEHLNDFQTALKHYRMYLYLLPKAKDRQFVQQQILRAELALRSVVDSPLEKEYGVYK